MKGFTLSPSEAQTHIKDISPSKVIDTESVCELFSGNLSNVDTSVGILNLF